jgi:hypothetical protein
LFQALQECREAVAAPNGHHAKWGRILYQLFFSG